MCLVEGCTRESDHAFGGRRGWCEKHYDKWRAYGNPLAGYERRSNGEGSLRSGGYLQIQTNGRKKFKHNLIIEKALGREIPKGAVGHHIDGNPSNSVNANLVLCDSAAYHKFIHQRTRAYRACGHANWRFCRYCRQYDSPENLTIDPKRAKAYHRECHNKHFMEYRKNHKSKNKEE